MKPAAHSMSPRDAAKSFYGQDEASFVEAVEKMTAADPRLMKAFQSVRQRYLDQKN